MYADIKLDDNPLIIVQPDLMIICDKDKLDGNRCNGVREYWIIDYQRQKVIVYSLNQTDFEMETYTFQDRVKVNIYDDLYIDFPQLDLGM